jgi:ATP-dependent DNA helicase PIF1
LVSFVYGDLTHAAREGFFCDRAILTPLNRTVDEINAAVLRKFPGETTTYCSVDTVEDEEESEATYPVEFLNSLNIGGLPPHRLELQVGAPIMLLRNLNQRQGLCNGTRMVVKVCGRNMLMATIQTGSNAGKDVFLPRISLMSGGDGDNMPFTLCRHQYPVKLAFALTINKGQGQSLARWGAFLPDHVFAHGQLYVTVSRGQGFGTGKIALPNGKVPRRQGLYTRNIVSAEIFQ